jgi:octaprenyl-diphosphate synthase
MVSVQAELEQSEAILAELLFSQHLFLRRLARHIERFRGKRLRPALVHFAARVFGGEAPLAGEVAALVEMIHLASLCHDDILDEAATRRNVPTLNAQWGAQVAVVTGDLLLSRAFARLATLPDPRPFQVLTRAGQLICEGELLQVGCRFQAGLSEQDYLDLIEKKTAVLFGASAQLGGLLAGASEPEAQRLEAYGRRVGRAFQIVDDCLDLSGVESSAGKSLGGDLKNGELTLPVIHLLRTAGEATRQEVLRLLRPGCPELSRERLRPHLQATGSIAYALERARQELDAACAELAFLPPSAARDSLAEFCEYIRGAHV